MFFSGFESDTIRLQLVRGHFSLIPKKGEAVPCWQCGGSPVQFPKLHSVKFEPRKVKPSLHLYLAFIPCSVLGAITIPFFGGFGNVLHRATIRQRNELLLHLAAYLSLLSKFLPGTQAGMWDQVPLLHWTGVLLTAISYKFSQSMVSCSLWETTKGNSDTVSLVDSKMTRFPWIILGTTQGAVNLKCNEFHYMTVHRRQKCN